jgi:hypothetical protein
MGAKEYLKQNLNEKSLSRLVKHMEEHDTGTMSAWRTARDCGEGDVYTYKENKQRNKSLLAKLMATRYQVTSVRGSYIENFKKPGATEGKGENVFFIVDVNDTGDLLKDMKKWGKEFDQDSVLFIPKGGTKGALYGTNKCPDGFPGWNKTYKLSKREMGAKGEFFTKVSGRPFMFKENLNTNEHTLPQGYMGRWGCRLASEKHWSELEL